MKWLLEVSNEKGAWTEDYAHEDVTCDAEAEAKGRAMIDNFNATLRPHEKARTFVSAVVVENGETDARMQHFWTKTSLVTISDAQGAYDKMRCTTCGITGKRFGLEHIRLDSEYRAKAFQNCDDAKALLAKRAERKSRV